MSEIVALGYIGINATDIPQWRTFGTDVLGLQLGVGNNLCDPDELFLRVDERAWRLAVRPSMSDGLGYIGWEVAGPRELDALMVRLAEHDIAVHEDAGLAQRRQVAALVTCNDPDENVLEFFYGAFIPKSPFVSPHGCSFRTGALGLGHVVLLATDMANTKRFYVDILGFRLSDIYYAGDQPIYFTRVNRRHHSLAFAEVTDAAQRFDHFMIETVDIDSVGRALDRVHDRSIRVTSTLGRHSNDHMLSFYVESPSGFEVEFGTDGRQVDEDTWVVSTYDTANFWGHNTLRTRST